MTTANKITLFRLFLVPFFGFELLRYFQTGDETWRWIALGTFVLAAITDGIDGYIARHFNQKTQLGAILDPIADKTLLLTGLIILSFGSPSRLQEIPRWILGTLLVRDALVLIGSVLIHFSAVKLIVNTRFIGKTSTVLQISLVIWLLLKLDHRLGEGLMIVTAGACAISGGLYLWDAMRQLNVPPHSTDKT